MSAHVNDVLREFGDWSCLSGTAGTAVVPSGRRVVGITAATSTGGSVTIDSASAIGIPASASLVIEPKGNLVAPTIIFDTTTSYVVEMVR